MMGVLRSLSLDQVLELRTQLDMMVGGAAQGGVAAGGLRASGGSIDPAAAALLRSLGALPADTAGSPGRSALSDEEVSPGP